MLKSVIICSDIIKKYVNGMNKKDKSKDYSRLLHFQYVFSYIVSSGESTGEDGIFKEICDFQPESLEIRRLILFSDQNSIKEDERKEDEKKFLKEWSNVIETLQTKTNQKLNELDLIESTMLQYNKK